MWVKELSIYKKFCTHHSIAKEISNEGNNYIHYRSAGLRYWIIFLLSEFGTDSLSNKKIKFENKEVSQAIMAGLNSNLFWWYYSTNYDMFNLTESNITEFRLNYMNDHKIEELAEKLDIDLYNKRSRLVTNKTNGGTNLSFAYKKKLSKPIIDEIDKLLAKHYGFTEEELDFIINYDIKYRMGDELNKNEE